MSDNDLPKQAGDWCSFWFAGFAHHHYVILSVQDGKASRCHFYVEEGKKGVLSKAFQVTFDSVRIAETRGHTLERRLPDMTPRNRTSRLLEMQQRANEMHRRQPSYNVFTCNCEHLASYIWDGAALCGQCATAGEVMTWAGGIMGVVACILAVAGAAVGSNARSSQLTARRT